MPTQAGRAIQELGVEAIVERSPQAKGRIERTWRTFQHQLSSEPRLAGASDLAQAAGVLKDFLASYIADFAKVPARPGSAYRKLDSRLDLNYIFSLRHERVVGKDHVDTAVPGAQVQLPALASGRGYARKKIEVCHQPGGNFQMSLDRRLLHIEPARAGAGAVRAHPFRKSSAPRKKKPVPAYCYAG